MDFPEMECSDIEENVQNNNKEGELPENFGFVSAEKEEKKEEAEKMIETPEMKEIKEKICQLLSRYPELVPRSSVQIEETLSRYTMSALKNIYNNCLNDLQSIRGMPSSEFIIFIMAGFIDTAWLPGYLDMCIEDEELKRDIESEFYHFIYYFGAKVNILFRFLNNAYKTIYNRRTVRVMRQSEKSKFVHEVGTRGEEKISEPKDNNNNNEFQFD